MAIESLTTSGINNLINSYIDNENKKLVTPLKTRKTKYSNLSTAYSTLSSKLTSFKSLLTNFKLTGGDSRFAYKKASSSNINFLTAAGSTTASSGAYDIRVNQLAKNDVALSTNLLSSTANGITDTHSFKILTGDGADGEFVSNIEVTFDGTETNQEVMENIRNAINADQAVVASSAKTASAFYSGGTSTFIIDVNGTEESITVNGGGTYEELIDEVISQVNENIDGVTAEKVSDSPSAGDVKIKFTVNDTSKYISISHGSGFDLVTDLGVSVTKEKGAAGIVTSSTFNPDGSNTQLSINSKTTGLDYRIKELSDVIGSTALSAIGLNLGASRPAYDQNQDPDTAGFVYFDITSANNQLNSKIDFNGLNIQRNSNSIQDLSPGVTFDLKGVMQASDTTVSVSVENDVSEVKKQIEDFITKFNDVYKYAKENSSVNSGNRGAFYSNANAAKIISELTSLTYTQIEGIQTGNLSYLTQLGISFSTSNGLSISEPTVLTEKLTNNMDQVEEMFNSTNGIANKLYDFVNPYLGVEGYIAQAQDSADDGASYLGDKITSAQSRIDKRALVLRNKYERLQAQLAAMMSSQSLIASLSGNFFQ